MDFWLTQIIWDHICSWLATYYKNLCDSSWRKQIKLPHNTTFLNQIHFGRTQNNGLQYSNNLQDQELSIIEVISFVQKYLVKLCMVAHVCNPILQRMKYKIRFKASLGCYKRNLASQTKSNQTLLKNKNWTHRDPSMSIWQIWSFSGLLDVNIVFFVLNAFYTPPSSHVRFRVPIWSLWALEPERKQNIGQVFLSATSVSCSLHRPVSLSFTFQSSFLINKLQRAYAKTEAKTKRKR